MKKQSYPALALICGAALSGPAAAEDKIVFIYVGPAAGRRLQHVDGIGRKLSRSICPA